MKFLTFINKLMTFKIKLRFKNKLFKYIQINYLILNNLLN